MFGDIFGGIIDAIAPAAKPLGAALLSGVALKHFARIPNKFVPWANGALGAAAGMVTTGDPAVAGKLAVVAAGGGTGAHQLLKPLTAGLMDLVVGAMPEGRPKARARSVRKAVGPGERFSL